jgi:hypothetical protein
MPERVKARVDEELAHFVQLAEYHSKLPDPHEGKQKPGDWRPAGSELCPSCVGYGVGEQGRACQKCGAMGYLKPN